jgi:hypothetical protein
MINRVERFLGRNVDEVRMELQTSEQTRLITLKEPFMYEYSAEPAGTVLQQRPEPGTDISGPTTLELVVSRGSENNLINLPNLMGLEINDALEQIGRTGIDFVFSLRAMNDGEKPGTVVAQNPAGDTLTASNTRVAITVAIPDTLGGNEFFGLFRYDMAKNPYPLLVRLECIPPDGERRRLLSVQYAGGPLTVPYYQPLGSVLVLYLLNMEIHRETVSPPDFLF